jgi:triphosphoribosyl-dephospho-CoA synthase
MSSTVETSESASPPLTLGACATLACIWEATAPKPGNVYRGADFHDATFADFLTSGAVIGPIIERVHELGVGATVLAGVQTTRAAIGPINTNLGMLLLIAPLAAALPSTPLAAGIAEVLDRLTVDDCRHVYSAIRLTQPGGLGRADQADVNAAEPPSITLREAMRLAADRDLVARQYVENFATVFTTADRIAAAAANRPLGEAIVRAFLELLRDEPDSLIARKCGAARAREVSDAAASVLAAAASGEDVYQAVLADFDFWLRSDGNRLNPGTSADIVAAALFVLLRERRLHWPVVFYRTEGE